MIKYKTYKIPLSPLVKARNFFRSFGIKSNPLAQRMMILTGGAPLWTKKDLALLTRAGYMNCSTVYACVNERAGGAAGIPWKLYRRGQGENTKKVEIDEHPALARLRRPNPQEGGPTFIKKLLAFYHITGNSYNLKIGPNEGPPLELYSARPDRMTVLPGNQFNPIGGYRYTINGIPRKPDFKPEEVLHLKTFHPLDDWYGLSPIEVAAKEIDINSMARDWNMKLLQNDCRPPGGIIIEGEMGDEEQEALIERFESRLAGYENAGRPPILEGGVRWEPWAISPKDMDWLQADNMNSRKICSIYNVAPEIIGDAQNKTYSNYKEARKALYVEAILPDLDMLAGEFNNWLAPAWGDDRLYFEYDKNSIDAIKEEMTAVYERQSKAHWRTINEKRAACGDDDIGKDGDVILIPSNLMPLADLSGGREEE